MRTQRWPRSSTTPRWLLPSELPLRERRIIVLRFFHHKTRSPIAAAVGISQMHVSRLLAHTLEQMRRRLTATAGY